jgi:putative nucleotidyltransferase with HDIG domain
MRLRRVSSQEKRWIADTQIEQVVAHSANLTLWRNWKCGGVLVGASTLEVLVKRIEQLPSLPTVVHELIEVCKDPNATMSMVEEVIRTDQSLAARMLKLVNSAFFALTSRVSTIHHAAVIMGMDALRNTAIAVCTYEALSGCHDNPQFDRRAFWEHAVAVAILAKEVAKETKFKKPDEAFVAGLLHDLGKVVLDKYFPHEFARALAMCRAKELPLLECESELLGFTHSTAGAEVAKQWNFPQPLVDAIGQHHDPAADAPLSAFVTVANELAKAWKFGASGNPMLGTIAPAAWQQAPVDARTAREIVESSVDEIAQVNTLFSGDDEKVQHERLAHTVVEQADVAARAGTRLAFITGVETPVHLLSMFLERSRFDVLVMRSDGPPVPDEAECVMVQMADAASAQRVFDERTLKQPFLGSLPHGCVGTPCMPGKAVKTLRIEVEQHAGTV